MFTYSNSTGCKWAIYDVQKMISDIAAHEKFNSNVLSEETVHKYLNTIL